MAHLLLTILLGTSYWQLAPRHGARMHMVYRSNHDKVLGGFIQQDRYSMFEVQCTGGEVEYASTEREAKFFVEACPDR